MGVANITAENKLAVTGALLIVAVLLARLGKYLSEGKRGGTSNA
jgi:hypothetical protein